MDVIDHQPAAAQADATQADTGSADGDDRLWSSFAGAQHKGEFCAAWLALQCRAIPSTTAGLLLLRHDDASYTPAAIWPNSLRDISHLVGTAERALKERQGVFEMDKREGTAGRLSLSRVHVAYPIDINGHLYGVIVLDVLAHAGVNLQVILRQLHWGAGWVEALFWRREAEDRIEKLDQTGTALDVLAVAQEHATFEAAEIATANELARRLSCDRVTIGIDHRRHIRLAAMSHSAWFRRKGQLVEAIESAMEEVLDQNATVTVPPVSSTERRISGAHRALIKITGACVVATVMIPGRGRAFGAMTFERQSDMPFDPATLKLCERIGVLIGPLLEAKAEARRWLAGRIVDSCTGVLKKLLGPRRPALKLIAATSAALAVYLVYAEGEHRVSAKSVIEGSIQRAAVAPFEGFIARAPVRAGDTVQEGQLLAALDNKDLALDRLKWLGERDKLLQKQSEALAKHDRSGVGVLTAQIRQAESELALVEEKLARTRITAPFDGLVVSGDLSQMLGSPVEKGKILFEIAPLHSYRVILHVDERDIRHTQVGQTGRLALTGAPDHPLSFRVTKVTPVSTAEEGKNLFRVEAELSEMDQRLRPGMEGIGKIEIGQASLLWIWGHPVMNWVHLTAWKWMP
jgi:multidrug efflux pump subunit AcrA (membrane-fusion protein)